MLLPNLPPPDVGIHHQSHGIDAYVNQKHLGSGTLYIAESRLSWARENSTEGLSLEYPHIAVHAVSRDITSFIHPCLYIMLDINIDDDLSANGHDGAESSDEEEDEDKMEMTEIRFVPRDSRELDIMYKSLNDCQILHPDLEQEGVDDDLLGDFEEPDYHYGGGPEEDFMEEDLGGDDELDYVANGERNADIDMNRYDDADTYDDSL